MRRGGRRAGRGAGLCGRGGARRGRGVRGTPVAGKGGFVSSVFALLRKTITARRTGWQPGAGGIRGIDDSEATGSATESPGASPIVGTFPGPRRISARRRAFVNVERCTACGTCARVCPAGAITVDSVAVVDAARCTGCGRCLTECAQDAITLVDVSRATDRPQRSTKKQKR